MIVSVVSTFSFNFNVLAAGAGRADARRRTRGVRRSSPPASAWRAGRRAHVGVARPRQLARAAVAPSASAWRRWCSRRSSGLAAGVAACCSAGACFTLWTSNANSPSSCRARPAARSRDRPLLLRLQRRRPGRRRAGRLAGGPGRHRAGVRGVGAASIAMTLSQAVRLRDRAAPLLAAADCRSAPARPASPIRSPRPAGRRSRPPWDRSTPPAGIRGGRSAGAPAPSAQARRHQRACVFTGTRNAIWGSACFLAARMADPSSSPYGGTTTLKPSASSRQTICSNSVGPSAAMMVHELDVGSVGIEHVGRVVAAVVLRPLLAARGRHSRRQWRRCGRPRPPCRRSLRTQCAASVTARPPATSSRRHRRTAGGPRACPPAGRRVRCRRFENVRDAPGRPPDPQVVDPAGPHVSVVHGLHALPDPCRGGTRRSSRRRTPPKPRPAVVEEPGPVPVRQNASTARRAAAKLMCSRWWAGTRWSPGRRAREVVPLSQAPRRTRSAAVQRRASMAA